MSNYKTKLNDIKAFAFDVDGVFTDGQVFLFPGREFVRSVNIKDGYAVQHAIKMDFPIAIISGGSSQEVVERFKALGVTDIYMKSACKMDNYEDFRMKYGLEHEQMVYMGDDVPDSEVMRHVGLPACPSDAVTEIKQIATYISDKAGGKGCARDIIEQVLRVQDKWDSEESLIW